MQPNKLGGHTFDEAEIGVINNAFYQARTMLDCIPAEAANRGDSPAYNLLEREIAYWPGIEYGSLRVRIGELAEKVKLLEDEQLEATITESQVFFACVKWLTIPGALLQPNVTSEAQFDKACQMVAEFEASQVIAS